MSDCPRLEADARQDGQRLGKLLQENNPLFYTFMNKEYGNGALNACNQRESALKNVMEEIQKLNPEKVQMGLLQDPPAELGHWNGRYFDDAHQEKGYKINTTNLLVSIALDDLKGGMDPAKVTKRLSDSINPDDAALFTKMFRERASELKLPYDITMDNANNLIVNKKATG